MLQASPMTHVVLGGDCVQTYHCNIRVKLTKVNSASKAMKASSFDYLPQ